MRIGYLSFCHHRDIHYWSGTYYYLAKTLEDLHFDLDYVSNLYPEHSLKEKLKIRYYRYFKGTTYEPLFSRSLMEQVARKAQNGLRDSKADILFSPSSMPLALLETSKPKVFYTDSCFAGMVDYYPDFQNFGPNTIRDGNYLEQMSLDSCRLAIYSSDWVAQAAIKQYNVDPAKVKVVPFGANIDEIKTIDEVKQSLKNKNRDVCKLLFIGVHWERKGGAVALEIARQLNESGIPTELTIVGCAPVSNEPLPKYVKPLGFLSKKTPEGRKAIEDLYRDASFLIVPSRAEAYGLVFCEANAFGLPAIATNVGGIPTIIKDNINGMKFQVDEPIENYVKFIQETFTNFNRYQELALSSFNEYETRLNWGVAGVKLDELFRSVL